MNESSHWYSRTGEAVFEVPNKTKGGMRKTTKSDAKKMGLVPSVTTILGCLAKPQLDRWKQQQVLLAALTLPRQDGETEEAYCDRIIEDAFEQVGDAADLGTSFHKALENHLQGRPYDPSLSVYVEAVDKWIAENGVKFQGHEVRLVSNEHGYAGTTDGRITCGALEGIGVVDFKTRKSRPEYPMTPWNTEPMQISAYADITKDWFGVNVYISTTEPGRLEATWYDGERLRCEFEAFKHILAAWRHINSFPYCVDK